MSELKTYLEQLLKRENITVTDKQKSLMAEILAEQAIAEAHQTIKANQQFMIDSWQKKAAIAEVKEKHVTFPNGTAGKAYQASLTPQTFGLNKDMDFELMIPDTLGLEFDADGMALKGTPNASGEYKIILKFWFVDDKQKQQGESYEKPFTLFVNADPKSLWKNLDSDQTDPYWKPDSEVLGRDFGPNKLIVASQRGRSHAHEAKFRDDAFDALFMDDNGWGIVAVADGAGSAKYSREGSRIACKAVLEYIQSKLTSEKVAELDAIIVEYNETKSEDASKILNTQFLTLIGNAAFTAQSKIREVSDAKEAQLKDYSTTLLFALVKEFDFGMATATFWVGDGGMGIYSPVTQDLTLLGVPDSGEFAGQTRFLTMPEIFADASHYQRVRFKIVEDKSAPLFIMSDGITDPKFQTDNNLGRAEKWAEFWEDLNGKNADNAKVDFSKPAEEAAKELLTWMDFWSPGNHDDRTLAILY